MTQLYMDHDWNRLCLFELSDVLDKLGLMFVLLQGTALGAYRDKGFAPTEKDIDLGVLYEEFHPKACKLVETLIRLGYEVTTYSRPFQYCRTVVAQKRGHFTEGGSKTDIVALMRWKDKRFVATPERAGRKDEPYALVHEAKILEPPYDQIEMFGREFNLPTPIETYLEREYGSGWRTPTEDHVSRTRIYNFLRDNEVSDKSVLS